MFNPLQYGTKIPMGYVSTGIVAEGIYYMNQAAQKHCGKITNNNCRGPSRKTGRESLIEELKNVMQ